jgi:Zn-dependent protease
MEPDGGKHTDDVERRLERPLTEDERAALVATFQAEADRHAAELEAEQRAEAVRDYRPVQPQSGWRHLLGRLWAPFVAGAGVLVKFGGIIFKGKFLFSAFLSVGWYTLFWGWRLAVGFVVLIFLHEIGHVIEARRQGLAVHKLAFVPIFGAYVLHERAQTAFRGAQVALAGPAFGGLASAGCWAVGESIDSDLWRALAYLGFLVNALNLLPFWILDGAPISKVSNPLVLMGSVVGLGVLAWLSHNVFLVVVLGFVALYLWNQWRKDGRRGLDPFDHVTPRQANAMAVAYSLVAVLLVLGAVATHLPDPR